MNFIASEHFRQSLYDYHLLLLFNTLDSINGIDSLVISIKQLSIALPETFLLAYKVKNLGGNIALGLLGQKISEEVQ